MSEPTAARAAGGRDVPDRAAAPVTPRTIAPYGEWISPLSAADVAAGTHAPDEAAYVGGEIWWSELADGRMGVFRRGDDGAPVAVLPAPWNARSRVHEYGGGAWAASDSGVLVFVEFRDQRLYRLDGAGGDPVALTPPSDPGARPTRQFGGLRVVGDAVLAIRDVLTGDGPGDIERDLVLVPLDGSAAADESAITSVVGGSTFLAQPRISPDGRRIAWIAWDHPNMPWQATELRVGDLDGGRVTRWRTVLGDVAATGAARQSVLQPEWLDDETLAVLSDRSGWWNLYRIASVGGEPVPLLPQERETGGPLWVLGIRWYAPLADGRIVLCATFGGDDLGVLDPGTGEYRVLRSHRSRTTICGARGDRVLLIDAAASEPVSLHEVGLADGADHVIRAGIDGLPLAYFPSAAERTFDGVHAIVYPPANPEFVASDGELPPYATTVHGGPTSQAGPMLSPAIAYYTSRGIGVIDVNYGGSTGYGRAYRERLDGQWGVLDVADVITAAVGLADAGLADRARLEIEGGSAGGWTVLSALTQSDVFACGISRYGVADPVALAEGTHDFESRYLDGLVGPYPAAADVYAARAPINHADQVSCPVLLLQGAEDRVVPPDQSRTFRDALAARGIPHAYLEFPGEGHGFRGHDAVIRAREASLSFLGQVLGFTPPGVPVLELARPGTNAVGVVVEDGAAAQVDPRGADERMSE